MTGKETFKMPGWTSWARERHLAPGPAAVSPKRLGWAGAGACTKLPLRVDGTPRDGHINKAHKKCTNIKSYKH